MLRRRILQRKRKSRRKLSAMCGVIILTCDWLQIVVPDTISACKRAKLTALGAALVTHGMDCEESEVAGRAMAERDPALEYVSPHNGSIT